jgi:hypothetical protein
MIGGFQSVAQCLFYISQGAVFYHSPNLGLVGEELCG